MFVLPILWLVTAVGVYIAALRSGMKAASWALAALISGPLLLPLFNVQKRMMLLKAHGREASLFQP